MLKTAGLIRPPRRCVRTITDHVSRYLQECEALDERNFDYCG
jgi:hypothetical protein